MSELKNSSWGVEELTKLIFLIMFGYSGKQIIDNFLFLFPGRTDLGLHAKTSEVRRVIRENTCNSIKIPMLKLTYKKLRDAAIKILKVPMPESLEIADPAISGIKTKFLTINASVILDNLKAYKSVKTLTDSGATKKLEFVEVPPATEIISPVYDLVAKGSVPIHNKVSYAKTMLDLILDNITEEVEISITSNNIRLNLIIQPDVKV